MKIIHLILILFTIVPTHSYSTEKVPLNSNETFHKDTVVIIEKVVDNELNNHYQQILEKTNNQLSLWWNPYGVFIAILGVLFAVLAIVAAFVIFRQSKEYKNLINKSLEEHKIALNKLIDEKNSYLKNYEMNLEQSIAEYKSLANGGQINDNLINSIIRKLEEQRKIVDTQLKNITHSGWRHRDIPESLIIKETTNFYSSILLNNNEQNFTIYIGLKTEENKRYWIGFTNNKEDTPYIRKSEYKIYKESLTKRVIINENIPTLFREGFKNIELPKYIDCIRLRGENSDLREIVFSYKFI